MKHIWDSMNSYTVDSPFDSKFHETYTVYRQHTVQ